MRDAGVRGMQKGGRAGRLLANVPSSPPALPAPQVQGVHLQACHAWLPLGANLTPPNCTAAAGAAAASRAGSGPYLSEGWPLLRATTTSSQSGMLSPVSIVTTSSLQGWIPQLQTGESVAGSTKACCAARGRHSTTQHPGDRAAATAANSRAHLMRRRSSCCGVSGGARRCTCGRQGRSAACYQVIALRLTAATQKAS